MDRLDYDSCMCVCVQEKLYVDCTCVGACCVDIYETAYSKHSSVLTAPPTACICIYTVCCNTVGYLQENNIFWHDFINV